MKGKPFLKNALFYGIFSGLIGGIFLTVLLKAVQYATDLKVYTLLLNVDYIPFLKRYEFSEFVEVIFHLIISITLGFILYIVIRKFNFQTKKSSVRFCVLVCFLIGTFIYPTTALSERTPPLSSIPSLFFWVSCHALYGYMMGKVLPNRTNR